MQIKVPSFLGQAKIKASLSFFKRLPWVLGERVFLFFMLMIFLAALAGAGFFFKFLILDQRRPLQPPENLPVFPRQDLQDIVAIWEKRSEKLQAADSQDYPDFFFPSEK